MIKKSKEWRDGGERDILIKGIIMGFERKPVLEKSQKFTRMTRRLLAIVERVSERAFPLIRLVTTLIVLSTESTSSN